MGKQFLIWFAAALVGGLLLLSIGSYLRYGGPPPSLARAWGHTPPAPLDSPAVQQKLRASAPAAPQGTQALKPGDAVPANLVFTGLDGQHHALAAWRGKRVVLNFWATWCHPCRKEMPLLSATQRAHAKDAVQIIGVAIDQAAAVRAFLKQHPVDYPIMLGLATHTDLTARFNDTLGVLPYSVLIGPDGRIKATHMGQLDKAVLQRWLH